MGPGEIRETDAQRKKSKDIFDIQRGWMRLEELIQHQWLEKCRKIGYVKERTKQNSEPFSVLTD